MLPIWIGTHSCSKSQDPCLPACTVIYQSSSNSIHHFFSRSLFFASFAHLSFIEFICGCGPYSTRRNLLSCYSLSHNFNYDCAKLIRSLLITFSLQINLLHFLEKLSASLVMLGLITSKTWPVGANGPDTVILHFNWLPGRQNKIKPTDLD